MPKIPEAPEGPRVRRAALPTPFMGMGAARAIGAGYQAFGGGLAQAAGAMQQIADRRKRKADAMLLMEATTDYRNEVHLQEFGGQREDGTEIPGYRNTRGKMTVESERVAVGELERRRQEIADKLTDPELRAKWLAETQPSFIDFQRRSAGYVTHETDRVAQQEFEDQITAVTSEAVGALNSYDERPDTALLDFDRAIAASIDILRARGEEMGWGDDWVDTRIDQMKSKLIANGVDALIKADKASVAKQLYDDRKEFVQPNDRNAIEAQLAPAVDRDKAVAANAEAFKDLDEFYTADQMDAIFTAINAESDAGVKANRLEDARARFVMLDKTRQVRDDENYTRLYNLLSDTRSWGKATSDSYFRRLEPVRQNALRQHWENMMEGGIQRTDFAKLYKTWEKVPEYDKDGNVVSYRDRTLQEKAEFNLLDLAPFVTPQDLDSLRREQNSIQAALAGGSRGHIPVVGDIRGRFNELLTAWKGEKLDDQQKGYLRQRAIRMAEAKEAEVGRNLSGAEMDEILGELFRTVHMSSPGPDERYPAGLIGHFEPHWQGQVYVPLEEIPPKELALVNRYVRSRLRETPTKKMQQDLYGQFISGQNQAIADFIEAAEIEEASFQETVGRQAVEEVAALNEPIEPSLQETIDRAIVDGEMPGGVTDENRQLVLRWMQEETQQAMTDAFRDEFWTRGADNPSFRKQRGIAVLNERTRMYWQLRRTEGLSDREARARLGLPGESLSLLQPDERERVMREWEKQMGVEAGE